MNIGIIYVYVFHGHKMKGLHIETLWISQVQQRPANALSPGIHQIIPSKPLVFTGEATQKNNGNHILQHTF